MQSDKQHEKKSILGELESIKDLLNEAELDNIPLLQDAIAVALDDKASELSDSAWGTVSELPDFVAKSHPLTSADTTPLDLDPDTLAELNQATQAINDVYNTYSSAFDGTAEHSFNGADDHPFDGDSSLADDSVLLGDNDSDSYANPSEANATEDHQAYEENSDLGVAEAISAYESLFAEVGVDINPSTEEQLDAQAYQEEMASTADDGGLSYEQQRDQGVDNHADQSLQPTIDDATQTATLTQAWDQNDGDPVFTQAPSPIDVPPGVLPGQQSLFEPLAETVPAIVTSSADTAPPAAANNNVETTREEEDTPDYTEDLSEIANQAVAAIVATAPHHPLQPNSVEPPKQEPPRQEPPQKFPTSRHEHKPVKARGENPFLPKHIRERLHTNKALVDIINEEHAHKVAQASEIAKQSTATRSSSAGHSNTNSSPALEQIINSVMAEYLPRIEQELRRKLQLHLQEHLAAQQQEKQRRD